MAIFYSSCQFIYQHPILWPFILGGLLYLLRGLIMFFSPSIGLEVLKEPNVKVSEQEPGLIHPWPPVYLEIQYQIRSWEKDGFWRQFARIWPMGIGIITCDVFEPNLHLTLRPTERSNFASSNNPDVESDIVFRHKLADSNKQRGEVTITKIKLEIGRRAERKFVHIYCPEPAPRRLKWGGK